MSKFTDNRIVEVIIDGNRRKINIDTTTINPITPESVLEGKEGFANDTKIVGTMKNVEKTIIPKTTKQEIISETNERIHKVSIEAVTSSIDENITPLNIRKGVTVLGIEGNMEADKPDQEKTVIPTKEKQIITADTGYELSKVIVNPIPETSTDISEITDIDLISYNAEFLLGEYELQQLYNGNYIINE